MRELTGLDCLSISGGNAEELAFSVLTGMVLTGGIFAFGGMLLEPLARTEVMLIGSVGALLGIEIGLFKYLLYPSTPHEA